jgi:hypothetical protein
MKQAANPIGLILAISIACWMSPATAADELEDLDVTMEVLDSEEDLPILVSGLRGPASGGVDVSLGDERVLVEKDPDPFADDVIKIGDGFDRNATFREDELLQEEAFETAEGEDVDLDIVMEDQSVPPAP